MREPIVTAKAGRYEILARPFLPRTVGRFKAFIAPAYAPNPLDPRKFWFDSSQYDLFDFLMMSLYKPVNCEGGIIRIGGSANVADTAFEFKWSVAEKVGFLRQMYLYTWPGWTIGQHLANLMKLIERWCEGFLGDGKTIWVDAECHANKDPKHVADINYGVIDGVESETGYDAGMYSARWFADKYMELRERIAYLKLWIATWLWNQPKEHPGPPDLLKGTTMDQALFQQSGSNGDCTLFGGVGKFDTDRWNGSEAQWEQEFGDIVIPDPTPPTPEEVLKRLLIIEEELARLDLVDTQLRQEILIVANSLGQLRGETEITAQAVIDLERLVHEISQVFVNQ